MNIRKMIFGIGCIFFCNISNGQSSFKLTYILRTSTHDLHKIDSSEFHKHIAIYSNNKLYTYYTFPEIYYKNLNVFGDKMIHHAVLHDLNTKENFSYVNISLKKRKLSRYFINESQYKWISDTTQPLYFKDYKCFRAYAVRAPGDTVFAVYTPALPYSVGPRLLPGLPGTAVQLYYNKTNHYFFAIKIEQGDYSIQMPQNIPIIDSKTIRKKGLSN
ncbi:MAG: GLPGLI family protein [Sphingobacteriales bacterium]|nr:MAG: GLPGLI family protein [Sphingobacteriales bacterium]